MFDILKIMYGWGETVHSMISQFWKVAKDSTRSMLCYTINQPRATSLLLGLYNPEEFQGQMPQN